MWTSTFRRAESLTGVDCSVSVWEMRESVTRTVFQVLVVNTSRMWKWRSSWPRYAQALPPDSRYRRAFITGVVEDENTGVETEALFLAHLDDDDTVLRMDLVKEMPR